MAKDEPQNPIPGEQAPQTPQNPSSKEIGLNKPTPFDGDRKKIKKFVQDCNLYLTINKDVYTSDAAKISFILSHMTEKEAARWKETYVDSITDDKTYNIKFPTIDVFLALLLRDFRSADRVQEAINALNLLKQGNRNVEELVTEFRLLTSQAGLSTESGSDNIHLIGMFRRALNPALGRKILFSESVPTTLQDWIDRAIQYDTNYRMAMAIMKQSGPPTYRPRANENQRNRTDR
jgi:Ty3 transposon capsid-like protein